MKKLFLFLFIQITIFNFSFSQDYLKDFGKAVSLHSDYEYEKAIIIYKEIIANSKDAITNKGAKIDLTPVYYNLSNSYYENFEYKKAIYAITEEINLK